MKNKYYELEFSATLGTYAITNKVDADSEDSIKGQIYDLFIEEYPEIEETELTADDVIFNITDWGELSYYENLQDFDTLEDLADYNGDYELDVISAGVYCGVSIDNIDEAYNGSYNSDEDFAEETAESLGYIQKDISWPYTCIDWEQAAKELMMDYSEHNGHYFRMF